MPPIPSHARVVIIGGGICGASTAYHLASLGITDVVVLEKAQLTSGSTWHAAGLVGQLRSSANITQLLKYSVELYDKLEAETGQATGWKMCGGLRLAGSEQRMIELRRAATTAKSFGLETNAQAMKIAANFLDELTDPVTGMIGYTKRGERSSRHPGDHSRNFPVEKGEALTAAGLSSRFVLGQKPEKSVVMKLSAKRLLVKPPSAKDKRAIDHYYWYHGTSAMQQMGGEYWNRWSQSVTRAILTTQRPSGNVAGSWDSAGTWGEDGGRIYATSLLLYRLQVTWRDMKRRDR